MDDQKTQAIIKNLNPDGTPLNVEKLKELSGLHDLSDEQAEEVVNSIRKLVRILFMFWCQRNGKDFSQCTDGENIKKNAA